MSTPEPASPAVEDRVVVYSAAEEQYCAGLLDGFRARHPGVAVEFVFGISVALHRRYLDALAAGRPATDVLWSSAMDLQMGLVRDGHALPHPSPEARHLPPGAAHGELAYATTVEPLYTLIHRERFGTDAPAGNLAEIAAAIRRDPERFRDRVACYDIASNGLGFLALLHESQHTRDFDACLRVLSACRPRTFGSNPALVAEIASGRAALGYHVLASYALRAARANPSVAIAATDAPPLAVSRIAFIPRTAPHPGAARLFLDYLLSLEGQRRLGEAGLFPIHPGAAEETAAPVTSIPIDRGFDALLDPQRRNRLLQQWQAAIAAPDA